MVDEMWRVGRVWEWAEIFRDQVLPWAPKSLGIYRNTEKEIGQGDLS